MSGQQESAVLEPLAEEERRICCKKKAPCYSGDRLTGASFSLHLSLCIPPLSCCSSSPTCHPIAPSVPFPPPKKLPFSPHQMVPKKEPLSRLVLPHSYLLIGRQRGENGGYWLPNGVSLSGRASGRVRTAGFLHPLLPRCCQNSIQSPFTLSLTSPPFLNRQHVCAPFFLSPCFLFRFLSLPVKCIANGSSAPNLQPFTNSPSGRVNLTFTPHPATPVLIELSGFGF